MAVPSIVASTVTCTASAPPTPAAPTLSISAGGRALPQAASLPQGTFFPVQATGLAAQCALREQSTPDRVDLPKGAYRTSQILQKEVEVTCQGQAKSGGEEGSKIHSEAALPAETPTGIHTSRAAALESAGIQGLGVEVKGAEGGGVEEGPAVKRKKSRDFDEVADALNAAVRTDATEAPLSSPAASGKQESALEEEGAGAVSTPDKAGEATPAQLRLKGALGSPEQQYSQQEQALQPQGAIATLRGYFLTTTERIASAVGGFSSRQPRSPPTLDRPSRAQVDSTAPWVAPPGSTPRRTRSGGPLFRRNPQGATFSGVAQGASTHTQGPGAWWNETSEDAVAAAMVPGGEGPGSVENQVPGRGEEERKETGASLEGDGGGMGGETRPGEPEEWSNTALMRWERRRAAWRSGRRASPSEGEAQQGAGEEGAGRLSRRVKQEKSEPRRPKIRPGTAYDDLLSSSRPFAEPIPLPEMVEFLVDCWREEGLYD